MVETFPTQSQVVIIGGGIAGCSIAYHLAKLGRKDVVVLERGELTSGTTWHAAGLVTQLRATRTMTELCRYGPRLFASLKDETGQDTGFKQNGSLQIARTPERLTEIARMISLGKVFGVEARMVDPTEAKALYPLLVEGKILGGGFIPGDGQTNPVDTTMALAKGRGAAVSGSSKGSVLPASRLPTGPSRLSRPTTERLPAKLSQTAPASGPAISAIWPASTYRFMPRNICM